VLSLLVKKTEVFCSRNGVGIDKFSEVVTETEVRSLYLSPDEKCGSSDRWWNDFGLAIKKNNFSTLATRKDDVRVVDLIDGMERVYLLYTHIEMKGMMKALKGHIFPSVNELSLGQFEAIDDEMEELAIIFPNVTHLITNQSIHVSGFLKLTSLKFESIRLVSLHPITNINDHRETKIESLSGHVNVSNLKNVEQSFRLPTHFSIRYEIGLNNSFSIQLAQFLILCFDAAQTCIYTNMVLVSENVCDNIRHGIETAIENAVKSAELKGPITVEKTGEKCQVGRIFKSTIQANETRSKSLLSFL
jgi:hypothetical protein